nr:hypothetical protein CKG001_14670 [Bdellovibrio sp. CKG001]
MYFNFNSSVDEVSSQQSTLPEQTDVNRAKHVVDEEGVPYLEITKVGKQYHPAWVATYALAYAGVEAYNSDLENIADDKKFTACINWLKTNLKQHSNGTWVWYYYFDSTYNDVSIKAPWSSPFAQALGIQAFLVAYRRTKDLQYVELAKRASQSLFRPLRDGGFLFKSGKDIFFEEIPSSIENPSHILNGHMRVLLALKDLSEVTRDKETISWLKLGADSLYRLLPLYDNGYWIRYDLNPQKSDLLFRFANPYGFRNISLAVSKITLRDPETGKESVINVGSANDSGGPNRIAGTHWGQPELIQGNQVRRLVSAELDNASEEMSAPHTYFYLSLPSGWSNNLRESWLELSIEYFDEFPGNMTIQKRSISPGVVFRDMRDGDLFLSGTRTWRKWSIPVRPSDLGYWVGQLYAEKHSEYLEKISGWDERFKKWSLVAKGYSNMATQSLKGGTEVKPKRMQLPPQSPVVPVYSIDKSGVVMQHTPDENTKWNKDGSFNPTGSKGASVYSPYIVALQLLKGNKIPGGEQYSTINRSEITRDSALRWILSSDNFRLIDNGAVYYYNFKNVYNDVSTDSGWPSSFAQAFIIKSLLFAFDNKLGRADDVTAQLLRAANSFRVLVDRGGVCAKTKEGGLWFEEVPNSTHILNGNLISLLEMINLTKRIASKEVRGIFKDGIATLKEKLYLFDTGYWLRYDQNPKKEVLLQIDWKTLAETPLIDEIFLENPQTKTYTRIDVGNEVDFNGSSRISGPEWGDLQMVDGRTARGLVNGYMRNAQEVNGGTRHNVYMIMQIPTNAFLDYFDIPMHRLVIRYKDTSKGNLALKIQSINNGNQLRFVPLRYGVWRLTGDNKWKEKSFEIRPQDLGWYKGADYQKFEIDQINDIAGIADDWFLAQYFIRHKYYLEKHQEGKTVIVED